MFEFLKKFTSPKPPPTYRDGHFGVLVRNDDGVWCGEMPFRNYHVKVLLPGDKFQPKSTRLAFARSLVPDMQVKVDLAMDYAAEVNPKLWRGRLMFSKLDLSSDVEGEGFALDFVATGDLSGKCWQVPFVRGKPVHLGYV